MSSNGLDAVFNRVVREGAEALSPNEAVAYRVGRLVTDFENGGFSAFLYNVSPADGFPDTWEELRDVAASVETLGAPSVGKLLIQAAKLLEALPPSSDGTWGAFIAPIESQLEVIEQQITPEIDDLLGKANDFPGEGSLGSAS